VGERDRAVLETALGFWVRADDEGAIEGCRVKTELEGEATLGL
jgi:hypothetical protein